MKMTALILALLITLAGYSAAGILGDKADIRLTMKGKTMTGHSTYRLEFSKWFYFNDGMVLVSSTSELEFPLDVYMGYGGIEIDCRFPGRVVWTCGLEYGQNINDPDGYMKDSDWTKILGYDYDHLEIYTESDAEIEAVDLNVYGRFRLWTHPRATIDGLAGYTHKIFTYEVIGLRGWYLDEDLNQVPIDESEYTGINVGDYEVNYRLPYLGFKAGINAYSTVRVDLQMAFSPYAMARDIDYHLLRNKMAEGDCTGAAFMADGGVEYTIPKAFWGLHWTFSLGYDLTTISTSGDQTQTWYGDDPASPVDDTGDQIGGLDYEIKSLQKAVNVAVSCRF